MLQNEIIKSKQRRSNYDVNLLMGQGIWKQVVEKFPLLESFIKKLLKQLSQMVRKSSSLSELGIDLGNFSWSVSLCLNLMAHNT